MKLFDFKCEHPLHQDAKVIELFWDPESPLPLCEEHSTPMRLVIGGPKSKHVSWSKWQI